MKMCAFTVVLLAAVILCSDFTDARRKCNRRYKGCEVRNGECQFGEAVGCENPFKFKDCDDCRQTLDVNADKCLDESLCRTGLCISRPFTHRGYKCDCTATGFYGRTCHKRCPNVYPFPRDYPYACIF